jgi:hypothetical protein
MNIITVVAVSTGLLGGMTPSELRGLFREAQVRAS